MRDGRTARINGEDYRFTAEADGTFRFEVDGGRHRFRQWTWGEKNRVIDASTIADPATGQPRVDIACLNESMLAATLVEADAISPIDRDALSRLNPTLGDRLLSIAYWVNELSDAEKKTCAAPAAPATATPT